MTRIFDNIELALGSHLLETLHLSDRLDAAVGYFNLRGWELFADAVDSKFVENGPPVARILIGMATAGPQEETIDELQRQLDGVELSEADASDARQRRAEILEHLRTQLMRGLPTPKDRITLQRLREQLARGAVELKVFTRRPLHGKTYLCHRKDPNNPIVGFVGSSNLTRPGLGSNLELNVDVLDYSGASRLAEWFDARWSDRFSRPISADLLALIDESWATPNPRAPYDVFLKVCYDLSRDVRDGLAAYSLPPSVRDELLEFQANAVQTLARRVMIRRGTMLGDVVGLGKTLTAIATALMLREEHNLSPIVFCPKNLVTMWEDYFENYDLDGQVIHYNVASRDIPLLRRKYRFVIVDESHTLRNENRQDYQAIQSYIHEFDCKVLLLTATPYNKQFLDVANQLGLYLEPDDDLGLTPVNAITADPRLVDRVDNKTSTLRAFRLSTDVDDWKRLMSEHLVRRTRSFVRRNFAVQDEATGREYLTFANGHRFYFPERVARPLDHSFGDNDPAIAMTSDITLQAIGALTLPRYHLARFLNRKIAYTEHEQAFVNRVLRGRGQVAGFVRTNFYKRLSSCGHSFILSLKRHVARNEIFLYAIQNGKDLPTGTIMESVWSDDADPEESNVGDVETEADYLTNVEDRYIQLEERGPSGVTWIRPGLFTTQLVRELQQDTEILRQLLRSFGEWSPEVDSKLDRLAQLVTEQHSADKILIFTEYKDTAQYIGSALAARGIVDLGVATGQSEDPTELARRFSPRSSGVLGEGPPESEDQIRILVATDVLSEGQNLQDSHVIVNYDLPWAIIRLIQRAGRADRLGQESDTVYLYSFFHESVETVISLRQRIAARLAQNAEAFGSDERFFGSDTETRTISDLYNGKLDDDEGDVEVDAASVAFQKWKQAVAADPSVETRIPGLPDLVHATRSQRLTDPVDAGVLCFVRTETGNDAFGYADAATGEQTLLTGYEALKVFESGPNETAHPPVDAHDELIRELVQGQLAKPAISAGRLRGVRRTVWNRLSGTLFEGAPTTQEALDALHQHPLKADAERVLRKAVKTMGLEDLARRITELHARGDLVIDVASSPDPVRIVCSMGVVQA